VTDWRKVSFDDQCRRRSFKVVAMDFVSFNYLINAWVDWSNFFLSLTGGDLRKVPFNGQHRRSFKMAAVAAILNFVSIYYLTSAWVD
jgi:hypothetical protein